MKRLFYRKLILIGSPKIYVAKNCDDIFELSATGLTGKIEDPFNEYINERWVVATYAFTRVIKFPRLF